MTAQRKITREVLENYLHCKTKAFLTLTGEFGIKNLITRHGAWKKLQERRTAWGITSSPTIEIARYKKTFF